MTPNMVGALLGFGIGFMGFVFIRIAASRVESNGVGPEPQKTAKLLRMVATADWIIFIVIGYFVGPLIVSGTAN